MAVRSWDELRLLRLARRVFTVVKKKKKKGLCRDVSSSVLCVVMCVAPIRVVCER